MDEPVLPRAAALLREHYGPPAAREPSAAWDALVTVILAGDTVAPCSAGAGEPFLSSPRETAQASPEKLAEALAGVPRARQKAGTLRTLARWWTGRFGDQRDPAWEAPVEQLRDELRAIRGVSLELADRLLLCVGGFAVYPLDRASIRIVCRHGWLGLECEYEEWQDFFAGGLAGAGVDLRAFSHWAGRVGRDFCGPTPRCDDCPLRPLLPEGGPCEPQA